VPARQPNLSGQPRPPGQPAAAQPAGTDRPHCTAGRCGRGRRRM